MVKLISMCVLLSTAIFAPAQSISHNKVPSVVINQFNVDFPDAKDVDWELDKYKNYHADFEKERGKDLDAWYSPEGVLVKVKEEIAKKDLPIAVANAILKQYASHRVDEVVKVTEHEVVVYCVEFDNRNQELKVLFNPDGDTIK